MAEYTPDEIRQLVRDHYGNVAKVSACGCGINRTSGCCATGGRFFESTGKVLGYSDADLAGIVDEANKPLAFELSLQADA